MAGAARVKKKKKERKKDYALGSKGVCNGQVISHNDNLRA